MVNRSEYFACLQLRKQICPLFSAVEVAAAAARELPENGVPQAFGESAVSLPEAESLQTQMPGPASRGDPLGKNEPGEEDAGCDETHEVCNFDTPSKAPQTLIGIDFMQDPKPVQHFEAMRAKLELLNKEGQKLHQLHQSESVEDVAAATGSEERCKRIVLDVQHEMKKLLRTNKHIFPDLLAKMTVSDPPPTKSDEASSRFNAQAMAVAVPTQAPLSAFDAETYPTCFVEFFYGDCAPNMCSRPNRNVSHEDIFRSLLLREELEYSLETDDPGAPYKANDKSRFDAAEFCCVFGDNVRRVKLLQSVNAAFERQGFEEDVRLISQASAADFLQANQSQDVISMANSTKTCRRVQLALRQLLFSTSMVPLTDGYRQRCRHLGHGLNLFFGALNGFSTHNFADGYHPLLYQLTGDASLNLKRQAPLLPSLQTMHKLAVGCPAATAKLFLLLEELSYRHLFCTSARIGFLSLPRNCASIEEDDWASTGVPGVLGFTEAVFEPLESQGSLHSSWPPQNLQHP